MPLRSSGPNRQSIVDGAAGPVVEDGGLKGVGVLISPRAKWSHRQGKTWQMDSQVGCPCGISRPISSRGSPAPKPACGGSDLPPPLHLRGMGKLTVAWFDCRLHPMAQLLQLAVLP